MNNKFYLVEDDDTGEQKLFANRINAIYYMFDQCQKMNAILYPAYLPSRSLDILYPNITHKKMYLFGLDTKAINDVFEGYYYLTELTVEDYTYSEVTEALKNSEVK